MSLLGNRGDDWVGDPCPRLLPMEAAFKNSFLLFPGKLWGIRTPETGFYLFLACLWRCVRRYTQETSSMSPSLPGHAL